MCVCVYIFIFNEIIEYINLLNIRSNNCMVLKYNKVCIMT